MGADFNINNYDAMPAASPAAAAAESRVIMSLGRRIFLRKLASNDLCHFHKFVGPFSALHLLAVLCFRTDAIEWK